MQTKDSKRETEKKTQNIQVYFRFVVSIHTQLEVTVAGLISKVLYMLLMFVTIEKQSARWRKRQSDGEREREQKMREGRKNERHRKRERKKNIVEQKEVVVSAYISSTGETQSTFETVDKSFDDIILRSCPFHGVRTFTYCISFSSAME